MSTREFGEPNFVQCVCFDPKGEFISRLFQSTESIHDTGVSVGVGFTNGTLQVLDTIMLSDVGAPFRYSRDAITHISFSHDSAYMATAVSKKMSFFFCMKVAISFLGLG